MSRGSIKGIQAAHEAARLRKERGEKLERTDPIEKARRNPTSLRLAVNAKCWDCQGAGADPGVRQAIRACDITGCSLHPVRPYQIKDGDAEVAPPEPAPSILAEYAGDLWVSDADGIWHATDDYNKPVCGAELIDGEQLPAAEFDDKYRCRACRPDVDTEEV